MFVTYFGGVTTFDFFETVVISGFPYIFTSLSPKVPDIRLDPSNAGL